MGERAPCDVLIVGAGHNGLVCAWYLAARGLKVTMLERRHLVGGAAVTEEFHPGFRNSVAAYTVSLLNLKVSQDLDLRRHGLRIVERRAQNFLPLRTVASFWPVKGAPSARSPSSALGTPNATPPTAARSSRSPTCCVRWC